MKYGLEIVCELILSFFYKLIIIKIDQYAGTIFFIRKAQTF